MMRPALLDPVVGNIGNIGKIFPVIGIDPHGDGCIIESLSTSDHQPT